jgi:hypothetical protein
MTSDRARVTYDPSRRYQGVVAQQGRISLEADWNEAQAIVGAELEARTLDIVGRAGSPDRGYEVTPVADDGDLQHGDLQHGDLQHGDLQRGDLQRGDLVLRAGTLYVGGQRLRLTDHLRYSGQPDWADHEGDPLWREPSVPGQPHELVYLLAREQEVSAVEDPALRDVALGGPDTTQRLRVLPRVVRHPTEARTWEAAWGQLIEKRWRPHGFAVDEASRALVPRARLQVMAFHGGDEAQPADLGGYLGPNNQLIRVQVTRVDSDGVPVVVWGYDNASFLYRLSSSVASASRTILRLATAPVDAYHQPRTGQVVEVLRTAAILAAEDAAAVGACVAASVGRAARVAVAYDPDSRELAVAAELPAEYLRKPGDGLPLFLRVWEGEIRCTPGEEHALGASGLRVRLTGLPAADPDADAAESYPVGAYWTIAVRPGIGPGAAAVVYPQRIMDRPQPPDGPRQWLTPLAFIRWQPGAPRPEDCVPRFGGAGIGGAVRTQQRSAGPSAVNLKPDEVGGGWGLQDAIDAHTGRGRAATVCLTPGTYALPRPLRIGPEHGRLTIRATAPGVILRAEPDAAERFPLGLITATESDGLILEGIEFRPPHARLSLDGHTYQNQPERARALLDAHRDRVISIAVHVTRCTGLSVERCHFLFSPAESAADLFGAAIFSAEELHGLRVTRCTFASREPLSHARRRPRAGEAAEGRHDTVIGVVHAPTALAVPLPADAQPADSQPADSQPGEPAHPRGSQSVPLLADAVIEDNTFEHVTAALVAIGQLGDIRIERNTARHCHAGFWLVPQYASHVLTLLDRLVNQAEGAYRDLTAAQLGALAEPLLFHTTTIARMLPVTLVEEETGYRPRRLEAPSTTDERNASELLDELSRPDITGGRAPAAQRETLLRRFLDTFGRARTTRAQPEQVAVAASTTLRCVLRVSANVLDCGDAASLVVLDTAGESTASLVLTGNHLRGAPRPGAVACLYRLPSCAAAANVITNRGPAEADVASLVVLAARRHGRHQSAITGNVLVGRAHLPGRPVELPGWESLNSLTR